MTVSGDGVIPIGLQYVEHDFVSRLEPFDFFRWIVDEMTCVRRYDANTSTGSHVVLALTSNKNV